jgi:hypothetical protein
LITSKVKIHLVLVAGLLAWIMGMQPVGAESLSHRLTTFPQWSHPSHLQRAVGDLYYPHWFAGTWDVQTQLMDMVAPLSPQIVTPGFESNRRYLNHLLEFRVRFLPPTPPSRNLMVPGMLQFRNDRPTSPLVADRRFNSLNLTRAYFQFASSINQLVKDGELTIQIDPMNPNRQITFWGSGRQLISTVTARRTEQPDTHHFLTCELSQQEFRNLGQNYINQVETTTAYSYFGLSDVHQPVFTADQVTAIYLSPQDPQFFIARDRPVALYRYQLQFYSLPKEGVEASIAHGS